MDHHPITLEQLADWLDGRLEGEAHREVEAHLAAGCADCQAELAWLRRFKAAAQAAELAAPPAHLIRQVKAQFRPPHAPQQAPRRFTLRWSWATMAAALLLLLAGISLAFIARSPSLIARQAQITLADGLAERKSVGESWQPLRDGAALREADHLRVTAGKARLTLFDGSVLELQPGSEIALAALRSSLWGGARRIDITQDSGMVRYDVARLPGGQSRFHVQSPVAQVSVQGTRFWVAILEGQQTRVTVLEGQVRVIGATDSATIGQNQAVEAAAGAPLRLAPPVTETTSPTPLQPTISAEPHTVTPTAAAATATWTRTPSASATSTRVAETAATATASASHTATGTSSPTETRTPTQTVTTAVSATPTATGAPSATSATTHTPMRSPTASPTFAWTATPLPTDTATPTTSETPTGTPAPSATDTALPTETTRPTNTPLPTQTNTLVSAPSRTSTTTKTPLPGHTDTPTSTPPPTWTHTVTATATVTRTPQSRTVTLQHGFDGYTGCLDVGIVSGSWGGADTNYEGGTNDQMAVRGNDALAGLIRFDLSFIPNRATITGATLSMYGPRWQDPAPPGGRPLTVNAYAVLRDWVSNEATWNHASNNVAWGVSGCNSTTDDRASQPTDSVYMDTINRWYDFRITDLVQRWVSDPGANHGVILKSFGDAAGIWLATSEHGGVWMHPKLTISYLLPN